MSAGKWVVRTHRGKNVIEKQTFFVPTLQKRKRKPPPEERLKRLARQINENSGYEHIRVKISITPER